MSIPVIDLAQALTPSSANITDVVEKLRGAATSSGFFYVKNHGISSALIQRQFELAAKIFALPLGTKLKYDQSLNDSHLGFEQLAAQKSDYSAKPDIKEGFYCAKNYPTDHPYVLAKYQGYGINQWPSAEVPEMEQFCQEYIAQLNGLAQRIMQLLALSLSLDESYFDDCCIDPMITLKMLCYPPHPVGADEYSFGVGAHTDWGSITILAQDECGGLEVCLPDGTWVAAPPIKDTFIVNLGDLIPRWSNDLYKSNPHRVRNLFSKGQSRYSIPFFYGPNYMTPINALPGTVKDGEIYRYAPCTAGEHMEQMYQQAYDLSLEEQLVLEKIT
ncbi:MULTISPECIES: isopenicillin N synthase family oxygenase [unclassified Acinetobacter]|uniref:isopenicillin N synthase family dioxygenase n=1 Tax=unclassified Acinetobacter TaxID=196816 RepID=UPI0015D2D348|nr:MULTISPECIES: isopenicillin N synthase family oxygenase [unclassified Acinetobacter]